MGLAIQGLANEGWTCAESGMTLVDNACYFCYPNTFSQPSNPIPMPVPKSQKQITTPIVVEGKYVVEHGSPKVLPWNNVAMHEVV